MKKILILLAVATITANAAGCSCCRRLCPWMDRGAYCGSPSPIFAPIAATTQAIMPSYQPVQYAAPMAAAGSCCPQAPTCSSWDPCQGQVNYSYPQAMPTSYAAPTCCPTAAVEPGCAYDPYMGGMQVMSGMPMMSSGCDTCGTGAVMSGGTVISGGAAPEVVLPGPTN